MHQYQSDPGIPRINDNQLQYAQDIGEAIIKASNNTPWHSSCLVQSFTAQRMLGKHGIPGNIYIGVRKGDTEENMMNAHAWSQCGESVITGHAELTSYTVVTIFQWAGESGSK